MLLPSKKSALVLAIAVPEVKSSLVFTVAAPEWKKRRCPCSRLTI